MPVFSQPPVYIEIAHFLTPIIPAGKPCSLEELPSSEHKVTLPGAGVMSQRGKLSHHSDTVRDSEMLDDENATLAFDPPGVVRVGRTENLSSFFGVRISERVVPVAVDQGH